MYDIITMIVETLIAAIYIICLFRYMSESYPLGHIQA